MSKNRGHGKVTKLPEQLRRDVENKLLEGFTYQQMSDHLKNLGHDVSKSSVHRFGEPFLKRFENVRMAKEYAQLLSEDNAERPTTELHEANNALVSQMLMEHLISEDVPVDKKLKTYEAISKLQKAQVLNERLKMMSRKEAGAVRAAMNMLKDRMFKEIQDKYPEVVAVMIKIADEVTQEAGAG